MALRRRTRPVSAQEVMPVRERRSGRAAVLQFGAVLVGAVATFGGTWWGTTQQLGAAREDAQRTVRAEAYATYIDATNLYAVRAQERFDSCVSGTDLPRTAVQPCAPIQDVYQSARFDYSRARNDVRLYGSARVVDLVDVLSVLLPDTDVGFTGDPLDPDEPIGDTVSGLMAMFRDVQRCEVAVVPPADCEEELTRVDELLEASGYDVSRY